MVEVEYVLMVIKFHVAESSNPIDMHVSRELPSLVNHTVICVQMCIIALSIVRTVRHNEREFVLALCHPCLMSRVVPVDGVYNTPPKSQCMPL